MAANPGATYIQIIPFLGKYDENFNKMTIPFLSKLAIKFNVQKDKLSRNKKNDDLQLINPFDNPQLIATIIQELDFDAAEVMAQKDSKVNLFSISTN